MEAVEHLFLNGFGKSSSHNADRPLILAFGHDEEISGPDGAAWIGEFLEKEIGLTVDDGVEMIVDEGPTLAGKFGRQFGMVGVTEKGFFNTKVKRREG